MPVLPNPDLVARYREVLEAWGEPQSYLYMAGLMAGMAEQAAEDHDGVCQGWCVTCAFFQQAVALKSAMDLEAGPPPYWG
jgi:hypothetical protein